MLNKKEKRFRKERADACSPEMMLGSRWSGGIKEKGGHQLLMGKDEDQEAAT